MLRALQGGQLYLGGNNSFSGAVQIPQGGIMTFHANALAGNPIVMSGTARLTLYSAPLIVGDLAGGAANTVSLGSFMLTLGGPAGASFDGVITGTGAVMKNGPPRARQNLAGANTWSGSLTVNFGALVVSGNIASRTWIIAVDSVPDASNSGQLAFTASVPALTGVTIDILLTESGTGPQLESGVVDRHAHWFAGAAGQRRTGRKRRTHVCRHHSGVQFVGYLGDPLGPLRSFPCIPSGILPVQTGSNPMATITSANSAFSIAVANLYPTPQTIQGYAADDAFSSEALDIAEIVMGVDGHMSGGFIFNPVNLKVAIMPDSPSLPIFENWMTFQRTAREVFYANGSISIPSIARKYTLQNGILKSGNPIVNAKKVLEYVSFVIAFERIIGQATG